MEKRVFRSWEDKRVFVFLISSIFTVPALIASVVFMCYSKNLGLYVLAGLCVIIALMILVSDVYLFLSSVVLLPEGIAIKANVLFIAPYKQISKMRVIYSKRDVDGSVIERTNLKDYRWLEPKTYIEVKLTDGTIRRITVEGMTKKLIIKILEEIKVSALRYSDALKDFDPVSAAKKVKFTFKEPVQFD